MTIDELLAAAGLTANDEIPIWDAEATGEPTKKITAQNLAAAVVALANLVTGVKGDAESSYRQGNVNLTPANIGAVIDISKGQGWDEYANPLSYDVGDSNIDHIKSNFRKIFDTMKVYPCKTCMGTWFKSGWVIFWGYVYENGEWGDLFYKAVGTTPLFYHGKLAENTITALSVTETVPGEPLPVTIGGTGATTPLGAVQNLFDTGVDATTQYPNKPGIYCVTSDIFVHMNPSSPYGVLVMFRAGYVMHLYLDSNTNLYIGFSGGTFEEPSTWRMVTTTAQS